MTVYHNIIIVVYSFFFTTMNFSVVFYFELSCVIEPD